MSGRPSTDDLLRFVRSGKLEWPWEFLRHSYFQAKDDKASVAELDAWVKKNRLAYDFRPDTIAAGKKLYVVPVVVFRASSP